MPTFYGPRKSCRGQWSEDDLLKAADAVVIHKVPIRQAARENNIPERTLRFRLLKKNFKKESMGGKPLLGKDAEQKLCEHIKKLQVAGFAPTRKTVRILAYNLAKSLGIAGKFSEKNKIAGIGWLHLFLARNKSLSVRQAEGVSIGRAEGMNKAEIDKYFNLLTEILTENDLLNKPLNIFNMDESGLQLNNDPGKVIAVKGSKDVHVIKAQERGETITIVACCNAEGNFLPPYCIFKGVNKQQIWEENMPPGAVIKMRRESAYINEELFIDWLETHFIPRKPKGKCLLILDGHGSHMNSPAMLETASENNIILLCLPSHTTHFLQPLDRSFFKPLKTYFKNACDEFVRANPNKKIERRHFGNLLTNAWTRAATPSTGASGFRATGVYPLQPSAIPDHAYLSTAEGIENKQTDNSEPAEPLPGPSTASDWTPTKILSEISPIQTVKISNNPKRRKQSAQNLTAATYIAKKKEQRMKKKIHAKNKLKKNKKTHTMVVPVSTINAKSVNAVKGRIVHEEPSLSSESEGHFSVDDSTDDEAFDENFCVACLEEYEKTKSTADWIQCIQCNRWLHETCTIYKNYCHDCGKNI